MTTIAKRSPQKTARSRQRKPQHTRKKKVNLEMSSRAVMCLPSAIRYGRLWVASLPLSLALRDLWISLKSSVRAFRFASVDSIKMTTSPWYCSDFSHRAQTYFPCPPSLSREVTMYWPLTECLARAKKKKKKRGHPSRARAFEYYAPGHLNNVLYRLLFIPRARARPPRGQRGGDARVQSYRGGGMDIAATLCSPGLWYRKLCAVTGGVFKSLDESFLRWQGVELRGLLLDACGDRADGVWGWETCCI